MRLSYETGLNHLIKKYTSYLRTNIQEVAASPIEKPSTKAGAGTKPTNATISLRCSLVTPARAVNDSGRINVTENRRYDTDSFVETLGNTVPTMSRNTAEGPGNSRETSAVYKSEENKNNLGLLIIEPQRNISHSVQHHPCESQAIQEALVVRIMNAQDLERNKNFFLYSNNVFHSLVRQRDDFKLRNE